MALSSLQMLQIHPWHQTQCCFLQDATDGTCKGWCSLKSFCAAFYWGFFYWNILLHYAENGDMNTPQTPSPWRHWRKYWSYWINLKCKQMDINVLESWIFQCGFFFWWCMQYFGILVLIFFRTLWKCQYFTVMEIHISDGFSILILALLDELTWIYIVLVSK